MSNEQANPRPNEGRPNEGRPNEGRPNEGLANEGLANEAPAEAPPSPSQASDGLEAEVAKVRDELLRALAEVENTRRRGERQQQEARIYAIDRFAGDLLPVAD